jgi:hypothetical protein
VGDIGEGIACASIADGRSCATGIHEQGSFLPHSIGITVSGWVDRKQLASEGESFADIILTSQRGRFLPRPQSPFVTNDDPSFDINVFLVRRDTAASCTLTKVAEFGPTSRS